MKILIFGDVVGEIGRRAVSAVLPVWKKKHGVDAVIVNIENIAHGYGLSETTVNAALAWGAQAYTTGDHAWDNPSGIPFLDNPKLPIVRPGNYPQGVPGRGYCIISLGAWQIAVINMQGQVFFKNHPLNPFHYIDSLLKNPEVAAAHIKLIDFQAEATSEKRALGWHLDGKITALWGTHTHVPTADAQILPQGTGYISDVGMNGGYHSVIGMDVRGPLRMFQTQRKERFMPPEEGDLEANALLLEVDPSSGRTVSIAHLREILKDK